MKSIQALCSILPIQMLRTGRFSRQTAMAFNRGAENYSSLYAESGFTSYLIYTVTVSFYILMYE